MRTRRGDIFVNPATGERVRVVVGTDDGDDRLVVLLRVSVGGAVVGEHIHPAMTERLCVLRGRLGVTLNGNRQMLSEGSDVTVAAGVRHDWWNAGDSEAQVLIDVHPARRFELMMSTFFGLARAGRTSASGVPHVLQLAVIAQEFSDVVQLTKPSHLVQRLAFPALATLGRLCGYRPVYREFFEPQGREEPDAALLSLLSR